jgi:phosphatidylglycerol---prolipoprotein diacylglyceryl transferase
MDGIALGPIFLRWNGLLIMIGFALGGILAAREAKRRGYDPEILLDLVLPLLIWGTIGARLWHVFTPPLSSAQLGLTTGHYLTHPLDLLAIWIGGLGFPGALAGGVLGLFFFCRKYELSVREWADILAPALALGQAVGRLGNYFNQELYGLPAHLPWQIFISPEHRLAGYESVDFYHPLFAYETILSLLNLFFLLWAQRRFRERLRAGDLFLIYLFNFGLIRFSLEFLRLDVALVNGVNINQVFAGVVLLVATAVFYLRGRHAQKL